MGNYDDGVGFGRDDCGCAYKTAEMRHLGDLSLQWTKGHVTAENKAFLRSLLPNIRLDITGKRALLVHGSPRKINEYVYEDRLPASLGHIAQSAEADLLVFGHTHLPYVKEVAGVLLVNDGSVGKPKDRDPRAAYALLDVGSVLEATGRMLPILSTGSFASPQAHS
jgi:putative phosphoesterase